MKIISFAEFIKRFASAYYYFSSELLTFNVILGNESKFKNTRRPKGKQKCPKLKEQNKMVLFDTNRIYFCSGGT